MFIKSATLIRIILPPRRVKCLTMAGWSEPVYAQRQLSKLRKRMCSVPCFIPLNLVQKAVLYLDSHQLTARCESLDPPGEFPYSSSSSFIPCFLVYVNRIKTFFWGVWGGVLRGRACWSNTVHDQWLRKDLTALMHVAVSHWMSGRNGGFSLVGRMFEWEIESLEENVGAERPRLVLWTADFLWTSSDERFTAERNVNVNPKACTSSSLSLLF